MHVSSIIIIWGVYKLESTLLQVAVDVLNVVKAGYGAFLSFKEKPFSFFVLVDKDDLFSSYLMFILNM